MCDNLYAQVWAFGNLYLAYRKARKGKRGQAPAASFEFNLGNRSPLPPSIPPL